MNTTTTAEEDRIRKTYAERHDGGLYSWFNPAHLFIAQGQEKAVLDLLRRNGHTGLDQARILDVGCGTGDWLRNFLRWGAPPEHVHGVDLLEHRVAEARHRCPSGVTVRCGSATALVDEDASFDIVTQFTVFTSILDEGVKRAAAAEMLRVLKPGGLIVWYDFQVNNPRNPNVKAIGAAEIAQLFPGCQIDLRRVTLAPPIARFLAGRARWLCQLLEAVPYLRTHYMAGVKPLLSQP